MFWIFLTSTGLALAFAKLGAMSAWMTVLKTGLMVALLVIALLIAALLWRKAFPRK